MPVILTLNHSETHYDSIRISEDADGIFRVEYAYRVRHDVIAPSFTYSRIFTKFEDVQHYLEILSDFLELDTCKPPTTDVQMDGFPCILMNINNFICAIRSYKLSEGIAMSAQFRKV